MSKTVFGQEFFLQNLKKNRSDVIGVIIFCEKIIYHQPFFSIRSNHGIFMLYYIKEMTTKKSPKIPKIFECESCDYSTCNKKDYDRHLSTRKHKIQQNTSKIQPIKSDIEFHCICGKSYKHRGSLFNHIKICTFVEEKNIEEKTITQNTQNIGGVNTEFFGQIIEKIVNPLVSSHNDLQNLVVNEIIPKIGNTNTNTMTNCNNTMNNTTNDNKFNMNIYLNEKCKDAMTLSDFIDNLQISDEDFETTRTEGIISGLTDIFTKELRDLDVRKLPIHCSDIKRETFYIKEENEWVKDDGKKSILSRAIDKAKGKANKFLPVWIDDHQNCWKSESPYHTEWMNVITMRFGDGDPKFNEKNTKKIIKNIANEVLIDKETAMIDDE